jgi:hypothetical protein
VKSGEASSNFYCIISETTEDRFDATVSPEEAVRIARSVVREGQAGAPVSIEHRGKVVRQLVLMPDGKAEERGNCVMTDKRDRDLL